MPYPKEWDLNPAYDLHREHYRRTHPEEFKRELDEILRDERKILRELHPTVLSTSISFTETTMLPTTGGNTLIYTGTLAPAGSVLAPDFVVTVTSNDPAVSPSVDSTGLVVTVPLPIGWVESTTTTPLAIAYATTSASTGQALSATITPSAPPSNLATSITFSQTS
jgi:hypothetical protein